MWEVDYSWEGFKWIVSDDNDNSVIAFVRSNEAGDKLLAVCNFTPVARESYKIGVPEAENYEIVFNSDNAKFGGTGEKIKKTYKVNEGMMHGFDNYIELSLPPMTTLYLKQNKKAEKSDPTDKVKKLIYIHRKECDSNGKKDRMHRNASCRRSGLKTWRAYKEYCKARSTLWR